MLPPVFIQNRLTMLSAQVTDANITFATTDKLIV
jgi:hypothetical protein